ncbi:hypothetical protein ACHAQA_003581 [Verticillium albo-atrum]
MAPKTVLVTGANGYIGNAVARAFSRAGWLTYGLVRSSSSAHALALEEIIPIIGTIDDQSHHGKIGEQLPDVLDAIVSTTEVITDYIPHYENIVALLRRLSRATIAAGGPKPTVIFTSGCKDYGVGPHIHGTPGLSPHTEESPINPPALALNRAKYAAKIFEHADVLAPVLVRPTNVYGRTSSYYSGFFAVAEQASKDGTPIIVPSLPNAVLHALHVDDCGDAYVAIASHPARADVEGQVFNVSAHRYETVAEVASALTREYGMQDDGGGGDRVRYVQAEGLQADANPWPPLLIDFPQWTDSSKLRRVVGWRDRRPLFSEALHTYRMAYEAAKTSAESGNGMLRQMHDRVQALYQSAD